MSLSVLNNMSSLMAQNELNVTNKDLQQTLFHLSSGSRLNSGSDDAAGLSIADGLNANITALQQSTRNANDGIASLQVADGGLSQVTSLLNRAVTLATESSTSTVQDSQRTALNNEFTHIKSEIDNIGTNTTYNNAQVFTSASTDVYLSDGQKSSDITVSAGTLSAASIGLGQFASGSFSLTGLPTTATDSVTIAGQQYNFVSAFTVAGGKQTTANEVKIGVDVATTLANLTAAINGSTGSGLAYSSPTVANTTAHVTSDQGSSITVQSLVAGTATPAVAATLTGNVGGWANGATTLTGGLANGDISTATTAKLALTAINTAITTVAATRGTIGATVNQLNAAVNVMNTQVQNLTSGESAIKDADIGQEVANLSKFQILNQTGISALAQANQSMQSVLKLLQ